MHYPPPLLDAYLAVNYPDKSSALTRHICVRLAELYGNHPLMRWFVHRFVVPDRPGDREHAARRIWTYAREHWPYTQEPGEQILTPGRVLLGWPSDCDDRSAAVCAMLEALRLRPWGMSLIGRTAAGELVDVDEHPDAQSFHIVPWVVIDGERVMLETCDARTRWAEHPIDFLRRVTRENPGGNTILFDSPAGWARDPRSRST